MGDGGVARAAPAMIVATNANVMKARTFIDCPTDTDARIVERFHRTSAPMAKGVKHPIPRHRRRGPASPSQIQSSAMASEGIRVNRAVGARDAGSPGSGPSLLFVGRTVRILPAVADDPEPDLAKVEEADSQIVAARANGGMAGRRVGSNSREAVVQGGE